MRTIFKVSLLSFLVILPNFLTAFEMPGKRAINEEGYYYSLLEIEGMMAEAQKNNSYTIYSTVINKENRTVAHFLAIYNASWVTNNAKILTLVDSKNVSVAHLLANYQRKWSTNNKAILKLTEDRFGMTVAHNLALNNRDWQINDREILSLRNKQGFTVAHYLARFSPTWTTTDKEILKLKSSGGVTVKAILRQNGRIN